MKAEVTLPGRRKSNFRSAIKTTSRSSTADQSRPREARDHNMPSTSFNESGGDMIARTNGSGTRMALERASSQATLPAPKLSVKRLESIGRDLLLAIGEDPTREGLKTTPNRFARWWKEFIDYDPGTIETTFAFESFRTDQMVACAGVPVFSLCEHHLLPFKCEISMAYIATEHVLGLSKFARVAHKYSHRLQVQERLVHQIADEITAITDARDVAVLARGEHLCMQMRGIKSDGLMSTSVMRGLFRSTDAREEFLTLALGKRNGK
jgi:GTP cyclohydrolase I